MSKTAHPITSEFSEFNLPENFTKRNRKIGATYRWGKTPKLWDFDFLASSKFKDEPRPAKYEGQRKQTAFQVDREWLSSIVNPAK